MSGAPDRKGRLRPALESDSKPMKSAIILVLAAFALAAQDASRTPLPLNRIEQGLAAHPPHAGDNADRAPYYEALDQWVSRPDAVYWDLKPETSNPDLHAYYIRAIEKALREAAAEKVESGATIWKLYSSGFLVKTREAVFAFDAIEGPFKSIDKSPDDEAGYAFRWTPQMRRRFAELVDVLFISHQHYDHTSYALVRELTRLRKTVVVPADLKRSGNRNPSPTG